MKFCIDIHGPQRTNPTDFSSSANMKLLLIFSEISAAIGLIAMKFWTQFVLPQDNLEQL